MNNYLMQDLGRTGKKGRIRSLSPEERRIIKARDLFENKHIGIEEIAEILEVDVDRVKKYLGKRRIESVKNPESKKNRKTLKRSKTPVTNGNNGSKKSHKLTSGEVDKITTQRNERIITLHEMGATIAEVAERENLTLSQAKEIYMSLGLSIYTKEERERMRMQEEKRRQEEAEEERKMKVKMARNRRRAKIKAERERQERECLQAEKRQVKPEIQSLDDIKREIFECIKQKNYKGISELGEQYLDADFLSESDRAKLRKAVDIVYALKGESRGDEHSDESR